MEKDDATAKLSAKQRRFVDEYLVDLNAKQAAIRAGYSEKTAGVIGAENLSKPYLQEEIARRMKEREARTDITQDMVLRKWWDLANADPNALVQFRRMACCKCWPTDTPTAPVDQKPNADCTYCNGEGLGGVFIADTRTLTGGAALLYDGVKQTKDGIEIKLQDRGRALENVARHLGMFIERRELTGKGGGPVAVQNAPALALADAIKAGMKNDAGGQ